MASAWGKSWGAAWSHSWGSLIPDGGGREERGRRRREKRCKDLARCLEAAMPVILAGARKPIKIKL